MKEYNLESYLSRGVANIVKGVLKASAGNPKESFFLMQYAKESLEAGRLRKEAEERGEHIPPFLIASITQQCNLHCKGCYARANWIYSAGGARTLYAPGCIGSGRRTEKDSFPCFYQRNHDRYRLPEAAL